MNETDKKLIESAKKWIGFNVNDEHDICENGAVYVGLTQILPIGTILVS